jgi:hypothetical protein
MDVFTGPAVDVTRQLGPQKQSRPGYECSSQRDSCLLAAGQLAGAVRDAIGQADASKHRLRSLLSPSARVPRYEQRHHCVFNRGELGQQVMKLENETNFPVPKPRQVYITEFKYVKFSHFYRSSGGPVQSAQQMQQRRFSSPRRPDNRYHLTLSDLQA